MARARKKSDDVYNARRRFRRQAERYAKKAETSTGATSSRYRALAQEAIEKALSTYQTKRAAEQSSINDLAVRVGARRGVQDSRRDITSLINESERLIPSQSDLRDAEAKAILSRGNIGSRFYGSLVEVWQGSDDIDQAIKDYFGADSLMDVLEELENVANIYDSPDETVNPSDGLSTLQIQRYVTQREKAI